MKDVLSFEHVTLSSGLRLFHQERNTPWLVASMAVVVGWRYDPPGREGSAHVLEHFLFEGTHGLPRMNLSEMLAWAAAQGFQGLNAMTGIEGMWVPLACEVSRIKPFVRFLHDFLLRPKLDSDLEKDREIVRNERSAKPVQKRQAQLGMFRALYGDHRCATITGLPEDEVLNAITADGLRAMHREYFLPSNMVMVSTGGVGIRELADVLEQTFVSTVSTKPGDDGFLPAERPRPKLLRERFSAIGEDASTVNLKMYWSVPGEMRACAEIVGEALGRAMLSRLREDLRLVYSAGGGVLELRDRTAIQLGVSGSKKKDVDNVIDHIYELIESRQAAKAEFENAKSELLLNNTFLDLSGRDTVEMALTDLLTHGEIREVGKRSEALRAVTPETFADFLSAECRWEHCYTQIIEE